MQNTSTDQPRDSQVADHHQQLTPGGSMSATSSEDCHPEDHGRCDKEIVPGCQSDLDAYEEVIGRTLVSSWVEIGKALKAIRDGDLYLQGRCGTFDEYLRCRWSVERTYAHRLIKAAEVYQNLLPIGNIVKLPTSESQVRPLVRLDPGKQQSAWKLAVKKAAEMVPTARNVDAAVRIVAPRCRTVEKALEPLRGAPSSQDAGPDRSEHLPVPEDDTATCSATDTDNASTGMATPDTEDNDTYDEERRAPSDLIYFEPDASVAMTAPASKDPLDCYSGGFEIVPAGQNILIATEKVERVTASVSARDLGSAADHEQLRLVRQLVPVVANLLNTLAQAHPSFEGHELSRALGIANAKLQVAHGWF